MITFNHERYIKEAIESVLNQVTDFEYQLVIGEDCSTDTTRSICIDYARIHPEKITLLNSTGNLGMMNNFTRTWKACDGEYIAFLEGDDYWTDSLKLQKQADFLDQHKDFSACFHNVEIKLTRNGENKEWILHQQLSKDTFTTEDILNPWFIPSPSFMFVNYNDINVPDWYFNCKFGDLPLMLLLSLRGPFKYFPDVMAVYRRHDTGMSFAYRHYEKIMVMIYIYESFNIHTHYRFAGKIKEAVIYEIGKHLPKEAQEKNTYPSFGTRFRKKIKSVLFQKK